MLTNWSGNYVYGAARFVSPRTLEELQATVAREDHVRVLGSRHSFTDLADTPGTLVSLDQLPVDMHLDEAARTVNVSAASRYGDVAVELHRRGWALANLASLPHISIGGAVATGTHGSGNRVGSLATAVNGIDVLGPDGQVRRLDRGDDDFDGSVVAMGALGVVTRLTLDVEPTFDVRQDVYLDLDLEQVADNFDALTSAAYSVSLFTDWSSNRINQAWFKSRTLDAPDLGLPAVSADQTEHMLAGAPTAAVTEQLGIPGPWHERLPHFRMEHTPSRGAELQSEYLLPRTNVASAVSALRALAPQMAPILQVCEIRTVASDYLWMSSAHGHDAVGFHFTWLLEPEAVYAVLPHIEEALLPLGGRPHWGKCFVAGAADLASLYPRWADFTVLRDRVDPDRKFGNGWLERVIG